MGNRLSQIATRTGDDGTTGLGDNTRVPKDHLRVHAMGDVDELNSQIGLLLCEPMPEPVRELLVDVQHQLFNLGGELSMPGYTLLKADALLQLDNALAEHNAALPRLAEFILPAGTRAASLAHVCRTVARRAERAVVALGATAELNDALRQYLNRLSDLLFVLARVLNRMNGGDDVYWKSERMARAAAAGCQNDDKEAHHEDEDACSRFSRCSSSACCCCPCPPCMRRARTTRPRQSVPTRSIRRRATARSSTACSAAPTPPAEASTARKTQRGVVSTTYRKKRAGLCAEWASPSGASWRRVPVGALRRRLWGRKGMRPD